MKLWVAIAVAGGLGSLSRHGVGEWVRWMGWSSPAGTLTVNVVGSLLLGALLQLPLHPKIPPK